MQNTNNTAEEVWGAIGYAGKICVLIDSRFDYDAFGSGLVLDNVLTKLGKDIDLIYFDKIKSNSELFIEAEDMEKVRVEKSILDIDFSEYDLVITVDTPGMHHIDTTNEDFEFPEGTKVLNIDHHRSNTMFGDMNYVLKDTASNCGVLYDLFVKNNIDIDQKSAYFILLGFVSDSGLLTYEITPEDFEMCAALIRKGADYDKLIKKFKYNQTIDNAKFTGYVMSNFKISDDSRFAYIVITQDELKALDIDLERVYNKASDLLRSLEGTDFSFVLKQDEEVPTSYSISVRARVDEVDVSKLCEKFNGGGHKQAAGGIMREVKSPDEALERILKGIEKYRSEMYLEDIS